MSIGWPRARTREPSSPEVHHARQQVIAYLGCHHTISLATDGPCGLWAATVFYVTLGFDFDFRSKASSRHAQNLAVNPRVAGTVNTDPEDWRAIKGIQLEGRAELVTRHDEQLQVMEAFSLRYPFVETLWGDEEHGNELATGQTPQRKAFRLRPERLVFYDHERSIDAFELVGSELSMS